MLTFAFSPQFISIYKRLKQGKQSKALAKLTDEIDVYKVGVSGAKNFFEDKVAVITLVLLF